MTTPITQPTECHARRFTHIATRDTVNIWQCETCGAKLHITLDMSGDLWRHQAPVQEQTRKAS